MSGNYAKLRQRTVKSGYGPFHTSSKGRETVRRAAGDVVIGGGELDRRTVAAGLAWAVPAIVVATASPAAVASGTTVVTSATAMLNPADDTTTFTVGLSSTAPVNVQFLLLDGAEPEGLPVARAVGSGDNTVSFTVKGPGLHAGPAVLTWSTDGDTTPRPLPVNVASPTTYADGSAERDVLLGLLTWRFTLRFNGSTGSEASTVSITEIRSDVMGVWLSYPEGPQKLVSRGSGTYEQTFTATPPPLATTANVTFSIDGSSDTVTASFRA
jgi:hypothetical protein